MKFLYEPAREGGIYEGIVRECGIVNYKVAELLDGPEPDSEEADIIRMPRYSRPRQAVNVLNHLILLDIRRPGPSVP